MNGRLVRILNRIIMNFDFLGMWSKSRKLKIIISTIAGRGFQGELIKKEIVITYTYLVLIVSDSWSYPMYLKSIYNQHESSTSKISKSVG